MTTANSWENSLLFLLLSLIWGSSFILMKWGLSQLSPYEVASMRMLSGGILLLPVLFTRSEQNTNKPSGLILLSGLLGSFFPAYLFCIAETKIDSALAGTLNALTPLFTLILGSLFFHKKIALVKWIGVIIGFAGMCLLLARNSRIDTTALYYALLIVLATFCYGLNVNLVATRLQGISPLRLAALAFAYLIPPSLLILWRLGFFRHDFSDSGTLKAVGASVLLGFGGTAIASVLYYRLIKQAGTLYASLVTYGIPFVAIGWGLLAGEQFTLLDAGCLLIILGGVWLTRKGPVKQT
ncbi:DMT family transporter [Flavihumibacter petaseus]|uniref:Putative DMT family transporter n=1 Tax=Flavihumibacter petaseus NBRC 106054 TaxID=1220578 RepID=A0A0E9MWC0_9BACT|nr:DMT family transporter [Flavihumibacter petaseus]GAO41736.1 putative DMT family transporter [Flavihumibacter petaseus NBRC 106054]